MLETDKASRDALSLVFSALADPTRRAILTRLSSGTATVSEIAEEFRDAMSLPAVTKHLKVLERARLISKTKDAQFRPCQIDAAALKEARDWIEPYRVHWEQRFDRLEAYLARTAPEKKITKKKGLPHARKRAK